MQEFIDTKKVGKTTLNTEWTLHKLSAPPPTPETLYENFVNFSS